MSRRRRLPAALVATALLGAAPPPASPAVAPKRPPRRIVSLNLCADELLIALADRSQIAGLTEWSRDPDLSFYAARATAEALPLTHRSAEEVIALRPDLVISASGRIKGALARPSGQAGARPIAMIDLPPQDDLAGIDTAIATVATAIGHPERGVALSAAIHAQLAAIGPPPGHGRVAAYYQRQGYLTGTGTLVDEMMHRVGLVNLSSRLGGSPLTQLSLEQMALARPDFLLMEDNARIAQDRGTAMLHHPLLARVVPAGHRLYIPEALTVCGGPGYPQAVRLLADELRAADRAAPAAARPSSARPLAISAKSP